MSEAVRHSTARVAKYETPETTDTPTTPPRETYLGPHLPSPTLPAPRPIRVALFSNEERPNQLSCLRLSDVQAHIGLRRGPCQVQEIRRFQGPQANPCSAITKTDACMRKSQQKSITTIEMANAPAACFFSCIPACSHCRRPQPPRSARSI